jgi:hypothetical protein
VRGPFAIALSIIALGALTTLVTCTQFTPGDSPAATDGDSDGAASDASDTSDAGLRCDADLCDDFDEANLGARWTRLDEQGGTAELQDRIVLSPPRALIVSVAENGYAQLVWSIPPPRSMRCAFSVRVAPIVPASGGYDLFDVIVKKADTTIFLHVGQYQDVASLREDVVTDAGCNGCPRKSSAFASFEPDRWYRIELETNFFLATLRVDGNVVVQDSYIQLEPTSLEIVLGVSSARQPTQAIFDDVQCWVAK